jgi:hypothetical protein
MSGETLFDMDSGGAGEPAEKLSDGRRRTLRQAQAMEHGSHPLALLGTHLRLHPDAPPAGDRKAPGPRCGGCAFIERNERDYLKCTRGRSGEICTPSFRSGPYETHGGATDLRAFWPGCEFWKPAGAEEAPC